MKYGALIRWVLLVSLLTSCVGNDDGPPTEPVSQIPDFRVLGEDTGSILQYTYSASASQGNLINLTRTLNVPRQFITLRQVNELLTFYSFASGNFSAIQFNTETGESRSFDNFYTNSPEHSVIWGANSESKLFLGYYSPEGSSNLGVRFIDPVSNDWIELNIAFHTREVFQPLYHESRLLVPYMDEHANYKVAVLDTDTSVLLGTWDFGSATPSIIINNAGNIVIFTGNESSEYGYAVYDFDTLDIISESTFSLNRFFSPGPLQADLIDGILYYLHFYAQPSVVPFGPAVYDFEKEENTILDMPTSVREVLIDLGAAVV
jgi:hypothetical protein